MGLVHRSADGIEFRGINRALALFTANARGFASDRWLTQREAGPRVLRAERNNWTPMLLPASSMGVPQTFREYFNMNQIDPGARIPVSVIPSFVRVKIVLVGMPDQPRMVHGAKRASYCRDGDTVWMPYKSTCRGVEDYYSTVFHEVAGHASGHSSRLNRTSLMSFEERGDEQYMQEDFCAEMTAAFLNAYCGMSTQTIRENAAYLWRGVAQLRDQPSRILRAVEDAQRAYDYALGVPAIAPADADIPK